ncbi:MAG: hypothetical protein R6U98_24500 [Pirellulaceae bacterium]
MRDPEWGLMMRLMMGLMMGLTTVDRPIRRIRSLGLARGRRDSGGLAVAGNHGLLDVARWM